MLCKWVMWRKKRVWVIFAHPLFLIKIVISVFEHSTFYVLDGIFKMKKKEHFWKIKSIFEDWGWRFDSVVLFKITITLFIIIDTFLMGADLFFFLHVFFIIACTFLDQANFLRSGLPSLFYQSSRPRRSNFSVTFTFSDHEGFLMISVVFLKIGVDF